MIELRGLARLMPLDDGDFGVPPEKLASSFKIATCVAALVDMRLICLQASKENLWGDEHWPAAYALCLELTRRFVDIEHSKLHSLADLVHMCAEALVMVPAAQRLDTPETAARDVVDFVLGASTNAAAQLAAAIKK